MSDLFSSLTQNTIFIAHAVILFALGSIATTMAFVERIAKVKGQRAIAEFRRQRRDHQAAMTREQQAHAKEMALLRERLRQQDDGPKSLDAIAACQLSRRPLMNAAEFKLFRFLERVAEDTKTRVWPQVPIAEILWIVPSVASEAERRRTLQDILMKRVDFAFTDGAGRPILVIEYQGTGHFQGNARWRDTVKKAIFEKAQIPLLEVHAGDMPSMLMPRLYEHLLPGSDSGVVQGKIQGQPQLA